jgi:hypothetical protein
VINKIFVSKGYLNRERIRFYLTFGYSDFTNFPACLLVVRLSNGYLTILDPLVVGKYLEKKIALRNIGQDSSLLITDMGLTHQPAVHVEKEQLVDLTVFSIDGKEQHLLPRIRIKPDLVLLAALGFTDLDTVDSIVTHIGRVMLTGSIDAGGIGTAFDA